MFRKNKSGIQISINFIVILVLAIFVFGLSVFFLRNIFSGVEDIYEQKAEDIDEKVGFISCGNAPLCLGTDLLEIERSKHSRFGVKINNYRNEEIKVRINVEPVKIVQLDQDEPDPNEYLNVIFGIDTYQMREFILDPNEDKQVGIIVKVEDDAVSSKYLINVIAKYCFTSACPPGGPDNEFGEGLYKLYVEVP